jgi:hypothetical protein
LDGANSHAEGMIFDAMQAVGKGKEEFLIIEF